LEDALAVPLDTFVVAVGAVELRGRWCVTAVFQAVRRALIDAQTRILAEEIVESRRVRVGS
jgi:hypothetical protein